MPNFPRVIKIKTDSDLLIREAVPQDAGRLLQYIEQVSGETTFLSFGPGEYEKTEQEQVNYLTQCDANTGYDMCSNLVFPGPNLGSINVTDFLTSLNGMKTLYLFGYL